MLENGPAVEKGGVVPKHSEAFKQLAAERNIWILIRPVNSFATGLIEAGFATKTFDVKGKSSTWGPHAGFIPFDASLSKAYGNEEECIKGIQYNAGASSKNTSMPVPLIISEKRLSYLRERKSIFPIGQKGQVLLFRGRLATDESSKPSPMTQFIFYLIPTLLCNGAVDHCLMTKANIISNDCWPHQLTYMVFVDDDSFGVSLVDNLDSFGSPICNELTGFKAARPLTVMSNLNGLPMTADYDVFAICAKKVVNEEYLEQMKARQEETNPAKKVKQLKITSQLVIKNLNFLDGLETNAELSASGRQVENDRNIGHYTQLQLNALEWINNKAKAATGTQENVAHHGAEQHNTENTQPVDGATAWSPSGHVYFAQNIGEMRELIGKIDESGYFYKKNPKHNGILHEPIA